MGLSEIFLILVVVLIVFGPNKLPTLARNLGSFLQKIRKFGFDLQDEIEKQSLSSQLRENQAKAKEAEN